MLDPSAKRIATELGDALRAFGFTIDALSGALDPIQDALVDLLIEHVPVDAGSLPNDLLTPLRVLGLVMDTGDGLQAPRDLRPYSDGRNDFLIVSDTDAPAGTGQEHVLGVGHASLTLASLVPRLPVGRALDLGTGSGVQALHLAQHAGQVVATDLSSQALDCAALSAALSGVDLDLRHGSLYQPVAGERFDLIVSNPPFVISPQKAFTYRDAGRDGDDFVRDLVSQAHHHLNDGGWFVTLANWLHPRGRDWRERIMEWIAPTGCDAWVVQRDLLPPEQYVRTWHADAGAEEDPAWLAWFAEQRIEAIGFGWIVLHHSGREHPHHRFEQIVHPVDQPMGAWLLERFAQADLAADIEDADLLAMRFEPSRLTVSEGRLQIEQGWRRSAGVDEVTAALVSRVSAAEPIGATLLEVAGGSIDLESGADLVRALLDLGALRAVAPG